MKYRSPINTHKEKDSTTCWELHRVLGGSTSAAVVRCRAAHLVTLLQLGIGKAHTCQISGDEPDLWRAFSMAKSAWKPWKRLISWGIYGKNMKTNGNCGQNGGLTWFNHQHMGMQSHLIGYPLAICCITMDNHHFRRGKSSINGPSCHR